MKVVIIIPTYNEEGHIEQTILLLQKIITQVNQPVTQHEFILLIYDSASTDATAAIVRRLQTQYSTILLLTEAKKSGLGSAYINAMQYANTELNADCVFEFDADGSHQPQHIPTMLAALDAGADVVMGSRYVSGGKVDADWAWHRHLISRAGNVIARFFLTSRYKDLTTGFRATRVSMLKKISLDKLISKNYAYKLHLFWELYRAGAHIVEVPITFIDRQHGVSKFPRNNIIESLKVVMILRARVLKGLFLHVIKSA